MDRPWLILRRVLDVGLPGLQADAEEDPVVVQAEADAHAQDQQDAGVEVAEEHGVAAVVPQAQHDAVAEAEADAQAQHQQHAAVAEAHAEGDAQAQAGGAEAEEHDVAAAQAQAQHAAVAEAEEDAQEQLEDAEIWLQVLLEQSVVNVNTDAVESGLAHQQMDADAPDFTITVALPPLVSSLFAGLNSHPDPARPDMYPYIIATGRFCLLVHFDIAPSYGTYFDEEPPNSHLVVVRHFLRADEGADDIDACAMPVPDRPLNLPDLSNIESVGLVCYQETGDYQIAELIVTTGAPQAVVINIRTDTGVWMDNHLDLPLGMNRRRVWVPYGTVTINTTVLWYDLSWGIISCDFVEPPLQQELKFHRLPHGCVLRAGPKIADLYGRRCIAISGNLMRYVEIVLSPHGHGASSVNMWCRDVEFNPTRWEKNYKVRFQDIWDHVSYALTELPQLPPMLVGVCPVNPNVVYFSLNQRIFGVNVPEHTVLDCQQYDPLNRPGPPDEPVTSRYLITWDLDVDVEADPDFGHQPHDPSDFEDSSASGMDEGDIDYETMSE